MSATALVAQPDRRFHAFLVDRLIGWGAFALAATAAWWWFFRDDEVWVGIAVIVAVVVVVSLAFVVALGLRGTSPGRALVGLRVVDADSGGPIGVGRALLRSLIVGVGSLPMFGLGLAALAWTAIEDRTGQRRGWHDHVARSVVLDVRPRPVDADADDAAPVRLVNLTAMRLAPVRANAGRVGSGVPSSGPISTSPASGAPGRTPLVPPAAAIPPVPAPQSPVVAPQAAARPPAAPSVPASPSVRPSPHRDHRDQRPAWGPPLTPAPQPPAPQPPAPQSPAPQSPAPQPPAPQSPPPQQPARPTAATAPPSAGATIARSAPGRRVAASGWRLTFDTGETLMVAGLTLVGRSPEGRAGEPVRHAVALPSTDMSLSKTHAQFHLASDGALVVTDRGSTNGSILIRQGVSRDLTAGRPFTLLPGDRVLFGDRAATVGQEL